MTPEALMPSAPALRGPTLMSQQWRDLTFAHWAVEPERVAGFMPAGVRPDVLDGRTYVGLVPFRMVDAGPGRGPAVPYLGTFLETNVRLYSVDATGRRGIVFLSLDCERLLVCAGARLSFGVPYRWARMTYARDGEQHTYTSHLLPRGGHARVAVDVGATRPAGELEHFLTARWGLHSRWAGRTWYVPNEHDPWSLRGARLLDLDARVLASVGLPELVGREPDHVAFSDGVTTRFGLPGAAHRARITHKPSTNP
jgi:uncharacterized protein YqjF (DUF2071 family)